MASDEGSEDLWLYTALPEVEGQYGSGKLEIENRRPRGTARNRVIHIQNGNGMEKISMHSNSPLTRDRIRPLVCISSRKVEGKY